DGVGGAQEPVALRRRPVRRVLGIEGLGVDLGPGGVEGGAQLLRTGQAIGVALRHQDRRPAPRAREQVPDAPATGTGEQPQLAVARLALEEAKHPLRVGAAQPLRRGHFSSLSRILRNRTSSVSLRLPVPWTCSPMKPFGVAESFNSAAGTPLSQVLIESP